MRTFALIALSSLAFAGFAFAQGVPDESEEATEEATEEVAPAPTVTYKLSGTLYVQVFKDPTTSLASISHDHVVKATGWSGTAAWNVDDPSQCSVNITVPVSGLKVDQDSMRQAVGLAGTLDSDDRATITENMLNEDQLNGGSFAKITYTSSSCDASGNVTGKLKIHGVSKSITVPMTITADGTSFSASGGFNANATDFGFEPYSALFGQLKNNNQMKFSVNVTGTPQ